MKVLVLPDQPTIAMTVANMISELLVARPKAVLGLATGSTPLAVYDELFRRHQQGLTTFADAQAFLLDEYVGLAADHPQRYRNVIARELTDRVDIDPANVHGLDGLAPDLPRACANYERALQRAGGIDLQLLGLGTNGHIAFNEPASRLASRTRVQTLTLQTRSDNARFFGGDVDAVPRRCLTQGLGTIAESRHAVVVATGYAKADAVRQMLHGPVSPSCPASILQRHPRATIVLDHAAARHVHGDGR